MARILIIDDNEKVLQSLVPSLKGEGYQVFTAQSGQAGLDVAREHFLDLVILDLIMPQMDGFETSQRLYELGIQSILIIGPRNNERNIVKSLEMGADDYMVKPFSPRELVARVKAVLRRGQTQDLPSVKQIGTLVVDEGKHQVLVSGKVVALTVKEFDLLCGLMKANGRVLNRDQIMETVWGYSNAVDIESRTVDVHIRRLREKLGEEQKRVVTVKGVGYRFDAEMD